MIVKNKCFQCIAILILAIEAQANWQYDPVYGGLTAYQNAQQQNITLIRDSLGRHPTMITNCAAKLGYVFQDSPSGQRAIKTKEQYTDNTCDTVSSRNVQQQVFSGLSRMATFNDDNSFSYTVGGTYIVVDTDDSVAVVYTSSDHLGSTRTLLSNNNDIVIEATYGYDPLGQVTITDGVCAADSSCQIVYDHPDLFQGHQQLSFVVKNTAGVQSGLVDNNDRFYSPEWGL